MRIAGGPGKAIRPIQFGPIFIHINSTDTDFWARLRDKSPRFRAEPAFPHRQNFPALLKTSVSALNSAPKT